MSTYTVPVTYTASGYIECSAESEEEAIAIFRKRQKEGVMPLHIRDREIDVEFEWDELERQ